MVVRSPGAEAVPSGTVRDRDVAPGLVALVFIGKVLVVLSVVRVVSDPSWAHLDGKAPYARAVMYPLWTVFVPVVWTMLRRAGRHYPWVADGLVTLTCLTDLAGNRLDLYNSVTWFDDAMHVLNAGLVSVALVLMTQQPSASLSAIVHECISWGVTASLVWELFEYGTFLTRSTEWTTAYSDTIGDLVLGWLGAAGAAAVLAMAWSPSRASPTQR
jgi:hypothetical protein